MEPKPFSSFFFHLLNIIFPPICILCGQDRLFDMEPICPECWAKASPIKAPICKKCGLPIGSLDQAGFESPFLCSICRKKEWAFEIARAGFVFDGPVRDAIHLLKYQGHFSIGAWLGQKMGEILKHVFHNRENKEEAFIVPVPLSPDRWRDREFNHSLALAVPVSKSFGFPISTSVLQRTDGAAPQVGLTPKERWSNVRGTFRVKGLKSVIGKKIILVDDVLTTGATSNECARVLKKAGAIHVEVWTLARTL